MVDPTTITVKDINLVARQVATRASFPLELRADSYLDVALERMVLDLRGFVYGERHTVEVRMPADWIEAVKERFAPAWVLRRWPVRYRDIEAELFEAYPEANRDLAIKFGQPYVTVRVAEVPKYWYTEDDLKGNR